MIDTESSKLRRFEDRPEEEVAKALGAGDTHIDPDDPPPATAAPVVPREWRVAKALVVLRDQINTKFPNRKKDSDGTIGDINHCPGSSDHCPNIVEGNIGVVTALDITHDPEHGLDAGEIAERLRVGQDPRIKYIISNGRIANFKVIGDHPPFAWRRYNGPNPHTKHFHVSLKGEKDGPGGYDTTTSWNI
ncbi:hypothetical protein [Microvirga sp. VF16]|uniref:hypothetical protein n=1 Tax=Microvirga sp. VF16 TaxID=2807101 RepID=UPI00193E2E64|nr:hypothetical protein [Microvirga sp. VF16]QRM35401.1 hypothetical protein JO965_44395 [Microvirga sp. VF16]